MKDVELEKRIIKATETSKIVVTGVLFKTLEECSSIKHKILRNTLSKVTMLLESIVLLYKEEKYADGFMLFRSMIDRYIHLVHLRNTDSYVAFHKWSFIKQYEYNNAARSDSRKPENLTNPSFKLSQHHKEKYAEYKEENPDWNRPYPEDVLKAEGLSFLYKFGYDHASGIVHPIHVDGDLEFHQLTGLEPNPHKNEDYTMLLTNSFLVYTMTFQLILNSFDLKFIALIYNYLEESLKLIDNDNEVEFGIKFIKYSELYKNGGDIYIKG